MKVLTLAIAYDEAPLIPYFVRHYRQLGDVMIVDDHSNDGTADVARTEGAIVLPINHYEDEEVEQRLLRVKNHAWKPYRNQYDWVIVVDIDEILYHEDLAGILRKFKERGTTVMVPCGYTMISNQPPSGPEPLYRQCRRGVSEVGGSKVCCFNPSQLIEINYALGAHWAVPTGNVHWPLGTGGIMRIPYPGLKLLHYHFMGADWVKARYSLRNPRRLNQKDPCLVNYNDSIKVIRQRMALLDANATEVV